MSSNLSDELKDVLQHAGCRLVRKGKGDHQIWFSPLSNKHFPVDGKIKSRHTANAVLRQAGLPKQF